MAKVEIINGVLVVDGKKRTRLEAKVGPQGQLKLVEARRRRRKGRQPRYTVANVVGVWENGTRLSASDPSVVDAKFQARMRIA